jgi:hypothetical protein
MVCPSQARFTLEEDQLYGWTMYPGYGEQPYFSPILVHVVRPLGGRTMEVHFLNILYAAGVQRTAYQLRTLRREKTYLMAEQVVGKRTTERVVIVEGLTRRWMRRAIPLENPRTDSCFDSFGEPIRSSFLELASSF